MENRALKHLQAQFAEANKAFFKSALSRVKLEWSPYLKKYVLMECFGIYTVVSRRGAKLSVAKTEDDDFIEADNEDMVIRLSQGVLSHKEENEQVDLILVIISLCTMFSY